MTVSSLTRPDITAVLANTGGGKTFYTKRHILTPKPARVLIWDFPFQEYADHAEYVTFAGLAQRLHGAKQGARFSLAVTGSVDNGIRERQFAAWCRLVMATARATGGVVAIVEELKDVTTASRAPTDWNILVRTGRKVGVRLVGLSQRPAQIDKDFIGQCTTIHCGPLGYEEDCKLMARELRGVTLDELRALTPGQWIESSRETGQIRRGSLGLAAPAAKKSRRPRVT